MAGHEKTIYASAVHRSGNLAATACQAGIIQVWNLATGTQQRTFELTERVNDVTFSNDGRLLYVAGLSGLYTWNIEAGLLQAQLEGQQEPMDAMSLHAQGNLLAAGTDQGVVLVWDLQSGQLIQEFTHIDESRFYCLTFHPTMPLIFAGSRAGEVVAWHLETGLKQPTIRAHEGAVNDVVFHPHSSVLATAGDDKRIRLWREE